MDASKLELKINVQCMRVSITDASCEAVQLSKTLFNHALASGSGGHGDGAIQSRFLRI